jgi:hypothetical protein
LKKKITSKEALAKLNSVLAPRSSILDIGAGKDQFHANWFRDKGHTVHTVDFFEDSTYIGDFNSIDITSKYDALWASHCLEHQLNVNSFLKKVFSVTKENGYIAITVPPLKHQIVGGHVTLWNAGLLVYNLVLAGFDCSQAMIKEYGYNISIIVQKKTIKIPYESLEYDTKDLVTLNKFFPQSLSYGKNSVFDGNFKICNWT